MLVKLEAERDQWAEFLNRKVGVPAFCLGIGSLGTPVPFAASTVALFFLVAIMWHGSRQFPAQIRSLRKMQLEGFEEVKLLGIERKLFGPRAVAEVFPLYLLGTIFLVVVWLMAGLDII